LMGILAILIVASGVAVTITTFNNGRGGDPVHTFFIVKG